MLMPKSMGVKIGKSGRKGKKKKSNIYYFAGYIYWQLKLNSLKNLRRLHTINLMSFPNESQGARVLLRMIQGLASSGSC